MSSTAESCLDAIIAVAGSIGASMTLLHVLEPSGSAGNDQPTDALEWEVRRHEAQDHLDRARARAMRAGVDTRIKIAQGHAAEQIMAAIGHDGVDLTVLSRHGQSGITEWSLGSTAQKILVRGRGSILIMPSMDPATAPWQLPPRRVLVPLDGSTRAECALAVAQPIAQLSHAELILLSMIGELQGPRDRLLGAENLKLAQELSDRWKRSATTYLMRLHSEISPSHSAIRHLVEACTDVSQGLLEAVDREDVDLVVMTAHGRTCNTKRSHGSTAEHLIHDCMRPILLVQDLDPDHEPPRTSTTGDAANGRLSRRTPGAGPIASDG